MISWHKYTVPALFGVLFLCIGAAIVGHQFGPSQAETLNATPIIGPAGPSGTNGAAATVTVGTVTTGSPGSSATVSNAGSSSAAVFNFSIPRGDVGSAGSNGTNGSNGAAATVGVGTVTTGSPGSSATVSNSGSSSAAILNFTIPRGDVGATGATGATGSTGPAGPSTIGAPTSRSLSLATAYQCTDNTKPCLVTATINSTVSFSLSGTVTNTAAMLIGSTNGVASGTGTVVGNYLNSVGGTIVIGLTLNNQATQSYTLAVPAGWYFAIRQTAGTVSIVSAFDQALG